MKFLIIFLACTLVIAPGFGQQKKPAAPNAEMQEEINDLKNDIKDLEAEIKDAEKNDPDEVPELKSQLAAMKKMLALMDPSAAKTAPSKPVKVATPASAYISPVLPVDTGQPVTPPTEAQAKDYLLWYQGKKIDDSTLVTTKGVIVRYNKKTGRLKVKPPKKTDPFDKIVAELDKSEQRKDELIDLFSKLKNGPMYYPDLVYALKLYDDITVRYGAALKNYIDLPGGVSQGSVSQIEQEPTFFAAAGPNIGMSMVDTVPDKRLQELERTINETLKRAEAMEQALPPEDNFPPPPVKDLSICSECDSTLIKKEEIEDSMWQEQFSGKEQEIMQLRMGLARQMALLGMEDDKIMHVVLDTKVPARMVRKTKLLHDRYGKDPRLARTITPLILGIERQAQLLGITDGLGNGILASLLNFDYDKYMQEQMDLKNYNLVLNLAQHIGLMRQKALLGAADKNTGLYGEIMPYINFNRFRLNLDLDFVYEQKDDDDKLEMRATGTITTKDRVYVQLYLDDCTWRMRLWEPDLGTAKEDDLAIALQVTSGEKTMKDENDKMVTYSYSGPPKVMAQFPDFRIDFCNTSRSDTAYMTTLNYPVEGDVPVQTSFKTYKAELLALANHMFVDVSKMEGHESEGMNLAADAMKALSQPKVDHPTGNPKLDKMQGEYNLRKSSDDFKKQISAMGLTGKSVFLFQANNGSSVLIDKYNDTKHRIDDHSELKRGMIHLRVVHDPVTNNN